MQDWPEDVERELQGMMPIYQNSTITLAAIAQSRAHDSLGHEMATVTNFSEWKAQPMDSFTARVPIGQPGTLNYPLNTRGWCLQETLLSQRILLLGLREMM